MGVTQLQDARPGELAFCGAAYDALAASLAAHADHFAQVVRGAQTHWTGAVADFAHIQLSTQYQQLTAAQEEMLAVGVLLHEAAAEFAQAQSDLAHAITAAAAAGCTVGDDGTVTGPELEGPDRHDKDAIDALAEMVDGHANRIAAALSAADLADARYASRLDAIAAHAADGTGLDPGTAGKDLNRAFPPKSGGPKAVNSWWKRLSPAEQQAFLAAQPQLIGNLDGIPATVRDRANRIYLDQLIAEFSSSSDLSAADHLKLDGFEAIKARLDAWGDSRPPLFLLALGTAGQGRGAIAVGDPDTATNVCAYVPGMGTTLSSLAGGNTNSAIDLWRQANRYQPGNSVIAWLGYDPPPGPGMDPRLLTTAGSWRGEAGGQSYDQFLAGLRASHTASGLHLTALGHSYGSFTVGQAAQLPGGTGADDIILIGSPGTGAQHASQLQVPAGHVWDGAAANDFVTDLPSKSAVGLAVAGPLYYGTGADKLFSLSTDPNQRWFGTDPASAEFGANRFQVAPGALWPPLHAHSQYFDRGSTSLDSMAAIMTGQYQSVPKVAPR